MPLSAGKDNRHLASGGRGSLRHSAMSQSPSHLTVAPDPPSPFCGLSPQSSSPTHTIVTHSLLPSLPSGTASLGQVNQKTKQNYFRSQEQPFPSCKMPLRRFPQPFPVLRDCSSLSSKGSSEPSRLSFLQWGPCVSFCHSGPVLLFKTVCTVDCCHRQFVLTCGVSPSSHFKNLFKWEWPKCTSQRSEASTMD